MKAMGIEPSLLSDLLQFLRTHNVAALATIKGGKARATTIYYYVSDDVHIYFLTRNETEKFRELSQNQQVGLVISDPQSLQTIQIEGVAREVDYGHEYAAIVQKYTENLEKNGQAWDKIPLNHMLNTGYYAFVEVTPTWIRWTDFKNWAHTVKFEQHFS